MSSAAPQRQDLLPPASTAVATTFKMPPPVMVTLPLQTAALQQAGHAAGQAAGAVPSVAAPPATS